MKNTCPACGSYAFKKNGYTRHGKQNHRCLDCGRQFSLDINLSDQNISVESLKDNEEFICQIVNPA